MSSDVNLIINDDGIVELPIIDGGDINFVVDGQPVWGGISGTLSDQTDLQIALDTKVSLTGNETIEGIKTFSQSPLVPTPTTEFQAVPKNYVDDNASILPLETKTADYTIVNADYSILADATSNTVTIDLPTSPTQGQLFNIKCIDATYVCTVGRNGNDIDGETNDVTMALNDSRTFQFDSKIGWGIV